MPTLTSIRTSIENNQALVIDPYAQQGVFRRDKRGRLVAYTGGFSVVYPFVYNDEAWAFRCWHADLGNLRGHFLKLSDALEKLCLPYFCSFTYVDEGVIVEGKKYPTTRMRWIEGKNLKEYICTYKDDSGKLKGLASNFVKMTTTLHSHNISHGDLQHGNILVDANDNLFLIDYDSVYAPELQGEADIIKGLKGYQHPNRGANLLANEKVDYFSELIIYVSVLAIAECPSFVEKYQVEDSEQLLFSFEDFKDLENSQIYSDLMQLGGQFPLLLKVLVDYLCEDDICNLEPFTEVLNRYAKEPKINRFETSTKTLVVNQAYKLVWDVENASKVFLNGEQIDPKVHDYVLRPLAIGVKIYELKVENGLKMVSAQLAVSVEGEPKVEMHMTKAKLKKGKSQKTLLRWSLRNVKSAKLKVDGKSKNIPMQGEQHCSPKSSTTYTIIALALDGIKEVRKTLSVNVLDESEIEFKADKAFTYKDVPVTLSWSVKNAKSVLLDGMPVSHVGKKVVTIDKERRFVLKVEDEFGTKQVPLTIKTIPLPLIKTVLLPMPKIEEKVVVQQRIPAPTVALDVEMKGLNVAMKGVDVDLQPKKVKFQKLMRLHPLSIKVGSGIRSRLKTALGVLTNNVRYLKFENDEK